MAIPGVALLRVLRDGYDHLQQAGAVLQQRQAEHDGRMRGALDELNQSVKALAEHYLPELSRPAVEATFAEVRHDLLALLAQQEQAQCDEQNQRANLEQQLDARRAQLDDITARLNEKVRQREQLEIEVARRLAENAEFQKLSVDLTHAEERLAQNERRCKEVEHDAAEKLPAYQQSRLFKYLHERRFGTPNYKGAGLFQRLDRWVAELIDYHRLRRSYEFLSVTPRLMADELARRQAALQKLVGQVHAREQATAKEAGLTDVLAEGFELGAQRDRAVAEIAEVGGQIDASKGRLAELAGKHGQFYERGVGRLRDFLRSESTAELVERAHKTWDPEDDPLVAKIVDITGAVERAEAELREVRAQAAAAAGKSSSLRAVVDRFQQANFDSERSEFVDSLRPESLVAEFNQGRINTELLWQQLVAAQSFRPMRTQPLAPDESMSSDAAVIIGALVEAVGGAMEQSARRGVNRRWPTGGTASFPTINFPVPTSRGGGRRGGFTTGDGF